MTNDAKKIWQAWGQGTSLYTSWAAARGINPYRLFVLYALHGETGITQKAIADYTGLSKQTVNTVIRQLKAEGIIHLDNADKDRREKLVLLTEAGTVYVSELLAPLCEIENRTFARIGAQRMQQMTDSIMLFNTIFEQEKKLQEPEK